jgi:hypothetical protein
MSVNTMPVTRRFMPMQMQATANGSYTLPQYAYIPDPTLAQVGQGCILGPTPGGASATQFAGVINAIGRPYPTPVLTGAFSIRQANFKATGTA